MFQIFLHLSLINLIGPSSEVVYGISWAMQYYSSEVFCTLDFQRQCTLVVLYCAVLEK